MMKTMIELTTVSRRVGQVTFEVSVRTCCKNVKGFVLEAISSITLSIRVVSKERFFNELFNRPLSNTNGAQSGFLHFAHRRWNLYIRLHTKTQE